MPHARNTRARNTLTTAAAVIAALMLAACEDASDNTSAPEPKATTSTSASSATPRQMEGINGALEPGAWVVPFWGKDPGSLPRAVVQVPEGYGSPGGWVVDRGADGNPTEYGSVSFWTVQDVVRDPCEGVTTFDPGPGVRDLARALGSRPGVPAVRPERVTVDGRSALYLEIKFPVDESKLAGCHSSEYTLWGTDAGNFYGGDVAGTVSRLWILDVDGTRVVMVADTTPGEDAATTAEVLGIARSAHFVEALQP